MGKSRKVNQKLIKNTHLEQIEREQSKRKKPGIGTYSIEKSLKQKEAEIEALKKRIVRAG